MGRPAQAQSSVRANRSANRGQRPPAAGRSNTQTKAGDASKLGSIRTLIVEDNEVDRRVVMSATVQLGLRAEAVDSGRQAIAQLQQADGDDPYDLLLIDFKMPDLDGLTASKYIKQELALQHLPKIVLLSAYQKDDIFGNAEDQHCVEGFLPKPIGSRRLAETIADLRESARHQGAPWPGYHSNDEVLLATSHVLLAEDNLINQQVAAGILARKGIKVSIAQDGQEAIDKVLANRPGTYDAILMDVDMPHVDGYQATRRIRLCKEFRQIPIIALTAHTTSDDRERCLSVGMSAYLTKPIKPDLLYQTLLSFLK